LTKRAPFDPAGSYVWLKVSAKRTEWHARFRENARRVAAIRAEISGGKHAPMRQDYVKSRDNRLCRRVRACWRFSRSLISSRQRSSVQIGQRSDAMSIFGNIMSAIFGSHAASAAPLPPSASSGPAAAPGSTASAATATVDVAAILDKAVAAQKEKLEWRTSIVDMMKALNLDSSLAARKELAKELKYTGDTNDTAKMNVWLHQQMMKNLVANGGKLPADIKW
jgi:hypothetical protein